MPRASLTAAGAALWHVLRAAADLVANRKDLRDGSRYRADLRITGTVAGYEVDEALQGQLIVSDATTAASSSGAPTAEIVAYLLAQVPGTRRQAVLDEAEAWYAQHHEMPGVVKKSSEVTAAKNWLSRLRHTTPTEKAGAVTWKPDADPDDLAAAAERAADAA